MLYAEHCQHCHGTAGGREGPTAQYLNPRPRDYRKGIFKFTSTKENIRAHRGDLGRIIEEESPGPICRRSSCSSQLSRQPSSNTCCSSRCGRDRIPAASPAGSDYSEAAIATRVEGGETRDKILAEFVTRVKEGEIDEEATARTDKMIGDWTTAQDPESRDRSEREALRQRRSFDRSRTRALPVEQPELRGLPRESGLGDGIQTYSITVDGETQKPNLEPVCTTRGQQQQAAKTCVGDVPRRSPSDRHLCPHRGGIKGTPMPAFGAKLTEQQKWDIVNYVLYLPHEPRTPGTGIAPAPATPTPKTTASK